MAKKGENTTLWWVLGGAAALGLYMVLSQSGGERSWENILFNARDLDARWKAKSLTPAEAYAMARALEREYFDSNLNMTTSDTQELRAIVDRIRRETNEGQGL